MTDGLRPTGIFRDLATKPEKKAAILIDCELAVDDFAAKHDQAIRQHSAAGGYSMNFEEGYQSAARLWRYGPVASGARSTRGDDLLPER